MATAKISAFSQLCVAIMYGGHWILSAAHPVKWQNGMALFMWTGIITEKAVIDVSVKILFPGCMKSLPQMAKILSKAKALLFQRGYTKDFYA